MLKFGFLLLFVLKCRAMLVVLDEQARINHDEHPIIRNVSAAWLVTSQHYFVTE